MIDFRFSEGKELALMFSRTCNIACKHCGIESSPRIKEKMSIQAAENFIINAATISDFKKVTFTGGEPLIFPSEHIQLLKLCRNLGLDTRIVSNGFWAKTKKRGQALLAELREAGLTELNFSADQFHLEFLEAQTLRNALDLARENGFARIVSFVSPTRADPLDQFAELYGINREILVDLRKIKYDVEFIDSMKDNHIFIFYGGLIGLGRAAKHPEFLNFYPVNFFPKDRPCREVVNRPVIYPNGSFQACCCAGGKFKSFTVGNAFEESISDLYDSMMSRAYFRLLNTHGPLKLFECIKSEWPELNLPTKYSSICELCIESSRHLPLSEVEKMSEKFLLGETLRIFAGENNLNKLID